LTIHTPLNLLFFFVILSIVVFILLHRTFILFGYLLLVGLFLPSCEKNYSPGCLTSEGKVIKQMRDLPAFYSIRIEDDLVTHFIKDSIYRVDVLAGQNLQTKIISTVKNGTLTVSNLNKCNFVRGYDHKVNIYIHLPHIRTFTNNSVYQASLDTPFNQDSIALRAGGSGDIHINGHFNVLISSSHGNGDMHLSGQTDTLFIYTNGMNHVFAQNLKINKFGFVHSVTVGDCHVNAEGTQVLAYKIQSNGNVRYTGQPVFITGEVDSPAKGKLIQQ